MSQNLLRHNTIGFSICTRGSGKEIPGPSPDTVVVVVVVVTDDVAEAADRACEDEATLFTDCCAVGVEGILDVDDAALIADADAAATNDGTTLCRFLGALSPGFLPALAGLGNV